MEVLLERGIHLPGPQLWLDPHAPRETAIVSHAHADHMQPHERVFATPATAAMMKLRGATRCAFETVPFEETFEIADARVTLYPAGHVLGSAQVLVEWNGVRLLYSGDFKLRAGLSAEAANMPAADIVIMETTFGRPRYRFPDVEDVLRDIKDFCWESLKDGYAPVLFCYSLGKGQEVLAGLTDLGLPIYLHSAHWKMANLYREFGVALPEFHLYEPGQTLDGVLLCASGCRRGRWFEQLPPIRTAYISGWAVDSGARWRFNTDAAFPLSDHADYDDLMAYVGLCGAQKIYTTHGFAGEFARDLRAQGYDAQELCDSPKVLSARRSQFSLF